MVKNLDSKMKYKNPNSHLKILDTERGINLEELYGASQGTAIQVSSMFCMTHSIRALDWVNGLNY